MKDAAKLILLALLAVMTSILAGRFLNARFFDYLALFAVSVIIEVGILAHREWRRAKGLPVANVGWYLGGLVVIFLLTLNGYLLNLAPPSYEYSSCTEFYQIVRAENTGCKKSDFLKTLRQERHVASGISFDKRLREALESDLEEAHRAERVGEFVSPPFPRLQQVWGEYQAARANQAVERQVGHWSTGVIISVLIFAGFVINGILSLRGTKAVGGSQAIIGLLVALLSGLFWSFQDIALSNYLPLNARSLQVITDYWYVGIAMGGAPLVLPLINDIGDAFGKEVFSKKALIVGVPALIFTAGLLLNPNLAGMLLLPSIFKSLLNNPDLSIQVIQLSLISGLLVGMGFVSFLEGLVKLINSPKQPAS